MSENNVEQMHLPLVESAITVLCFFRCAHVVRSPDPQIAHDLMEQHYAEKHVRQIDRMVAIVTGRRKGSDATSST